MNLVTPISRAEAALDAVRSVWYRTAMIAAAAWLGVVAGHWAAESRLDLWVGNPYCWLFYQFGSLEHGWGVIFLLLQSFAFYVWMFTDAKRLISLTLSFVSNGLEVFIVERAKTWTWQNDPVLWLYVAFAARVLIGTFTGWIIFRLGRLTYRRVATPRRGQAMRK